MLDTATPSASMRHFYALLHLMLDVPRDRRADAHYVFAEEGPELLKTIATQPDFLDGIPYHAPQESHSRTKVLGDHPVILLMRWKAGYTVAPHSHWGEPCFDFVVDGGFEVTTYQETRKEKDVYALTPVQRRTYGRGECPVVDNVHVRIHDVRALEDTCSVHVYPNNHDHTHLFKKRDDGLYDRVRVALHEY